MLQIYTKNTTKDKSIMRYHVICVQCEKVIEIKSDIQSRNVRILQFSGILITWMGLFVVKMMCISSTIKHKTNLTD